jgi:hypothetical protein
MKSKWVTWKGQRILYQEFSGFGRDAEALEREVDLVDAEIVKQAPGSILALADLNGTVTSSAVVELFKRSASVTKPFVAKQAVIGVGGVQKFLAQMVARASGQALQLFNSREEAMDWLAGEAPTAGEVIGKR